MEYIQVTAANIDTEHICCALSNNEDVQVSSKKAWLKERFDDGLVFLKSTERGKCFIEYLPAENAWLGLQAEGYMYIDCLWVSGSFKGHGYSNDLLNACIKDSQKKGKSGICILSSAKKRPFLADPKYLFYKGFQVADESDAGINLMYLPFDSKHPVPKFSDAARHPHVETDGFVLYYTSQCPFNAKYVPILSDTAEKHKIPFQAVHVETTAQAQAVPSPCRTYALFFNGQFVTNEELSESGFLKLAAKLQG